MHQQQVEGSFNDTWTAELIFIVLEAETITYLMDESINRKRILSYF